MVLRGDTSRCGSLVKKQIFIGMTLTKMAARFRVKIYEKAVVSNHLHLVLKFSKTEDYKNFVRAEAEGIINYQIRRQRKWPPAMNISSFIDYFAAPVLVVGAPWETACLGNSFSACSFVLPAALVTMFLHVGGNESE